MMALTKYIRRIAFNILRMVTCLNKRKTRNGTRKYKCLNTELGSICSMVNNMVSFIQTVHYKKKTQECCSSNT
jgi:hypothetical protein